MATRKRYALKKTSLEYLDYAENEILTMTELRSASRVIQLHSHQNGPDVFYTVMELGGVDFFDLTNGRRLRDPLLRRDYFRQMCICTQQLHKVCLPMFASMSCSSFSDFFTCNCVFSFSWAKFIAISNAKTLFRPCRNRV
jgi:serine/threonine protein kinase